MAKQPKRASSSPLTGKKGGQVMAASAVGAVVGGTIGAVAGLAMTNERTRKTVSSMAHNVKDYALETVHEAEKAQAQSKSRSKSAKQSK